MRIVTLKLAELLMAKKNGHSIGSPFGKRLALIRKTKGITQAELSRRIGVSRRMMAYYESEASGYVPGKLLPLIAKALGTSTDELLGVKSAKVESPKESMRLLNKLRIISRLPQRERKSVLDFAQALLAKTSSPKSA